MSDDILQQQQQYYSARAPEYDEWWSRRGRYDRGDEVNRLWFQEVAELQTIVDEVDLTGDLLELAGGTGNWTVRLAAKAERLTVLDGSSEMISINRRRLREAGLVDRVEYRQVDLFAWQSERQYDVLFIGFWLSHVPLEQLDPFLGKVAAALPAGGRLVLVDSLRHEGTTTADQPLAPEGIDFVTRRLKDGQEFQIVKRYDQPADLEKRLASHGFVARAATTANHFLYCLATRQS